MTPTVSVTAVVGYRDDAESYVGVAFVLGSDVSMSNSNSIYARSQYYWWVGGRVFSHRAAPNQPTSFLTNVHNLTVTNHEIQDPFPTLNGM